MKIWKKEAISSIYEIFFNVPYFGTDNNLVSKIFPFARKMIKKKRFLTSLK